MKSPGVPRLRWRGRGWAGEGHSLSLVIVGEASILAGWLEGGFAFSSPAEGPGGSTVKSEEADLPRVGAIKTLRNPCSQEVQCAVEIPLQSGAPPADC